MNFIQDVTDRVQLKLRFRCLPYRPSSLRRPPAARRPLLRRGRPAWSRRGRPRPTSTRTPPRSRTPSRGASTPPPPCSARWSGRGSCPRAWGASAACWRRRRGGRGLGPMPGGRAAVQKWWRSLFCWWQIGDTDNACNWYDINNCSVVKVSC